MERGTESPDVRTERNTHMNKIITRSLITASIAAASLGGFALAGQAPTPPAAHAAAPSTHGPIVITEEKPTTAPTPSDIPAPSTTAPTTEAAPESKAPEATTPAPTTAPEKSGRPDKPAATPTERSTEQVEADAWEAWDAQWEDYIWEEALVSGFEAGFQGFYETIPAELPDSLAIPALDGSGFYMFEIIIDEGPEADTCNA